MSDTGSESGPTSNTAIAPRRAPVSEDATSRRPRRFNHDVERLGAACSHHIRLEAMERFGGIAVLIDVVPDFLDGSSYSMIADAPDF